MSSRHDDRPKAIEGRARTVRELLDKARYTIDFFQREYAWQARQVRELIDDLAAKFLDFYEDDHERHAVEHYGHYFLGSVVLSHKRGQWYIVDGQQRLTTLTLLLIHLHNLQADRPDQVEVQNLIYSERYGTKSFNLDVPDWFPHPSDFETERNRIGGLVLLQRGINQGLGDAPYEDKRASSIGVRLPGGWADEAAWPQVIEQAVDAMGRLYAAIVPHVRDIGGKS